MVVNQLQDAEGRLKLKIADVIIELKSRFKMQPLTGKYDWRYENFIYNGKKNPEIILEVEARAKAPLFYKSNRIFTTIHPAKQINWSLLKKGNNYAIRQYASQKRQCAILNRSFSKGTVYLLSKKKDITWSLEDIIYDLLQIILINYLSKKEGVFVHSIGLKDIDKSGLLFAGPTQSGKSTTARLWHKYSKAEVLNDDRMVIRKIKGKFYIFGTPWHGDFKDYLKSKPDRAELKSIFFIYHNPKNKLDRLQPKEVFGHLYPNIFATFWDRRSLCRQVNLCKDLVRLIPSCRLGFKKDKSVISLVRSRIKKLH